MKKTSTCTSLTICMVLISSAVLAKQTPAYFQITAYYFKSAEKEKLIDDYLQNALLPAMRNAGTKSIGVFKPLANDTAANKSIYVLRTIKHLKQLVKEKERLAKNTVYQNAASKYLAGTNKGPVFTRMENIILKAFSDAPVLTLPSLASPMQDHIYELRSYEGASEKLFSNKVEMFNAGGEAALFKRLNFNAVFYGEVLAGSKMPNLMYMTSFANMADRPAHWDAFRDDAEWKKLAAIPKYSGNVSHIDITLMEAAPYSDF